MAVLALAVFPAVASTIYSVRADWDAAVTSSYTAGFTGPAVGSQVNYHTASGYTAGPINVVGYGEGGIYYLRNRNDATASPFNWGTGAVLESSINYGSTRLVVTLSGSPSAFGLNLMTVGGGAPVALSINGGAEITIPTSSVRTAPTFWGITDDSAINTVALRPLATSTALLIDNVAAAMAIAAPAAEEVPETSTVLLAASGLILIGIWRRTMPRRR